MELEQKISSDTTGLFPTSFMVSDHTYLLSTSYSHIGAEGTKKDSCPRRDRAGVSRKGILNVDE